jgi:hypothetical protein
MNQEVELKVALANVIKQVITDWQDDIGYDWTNKECAKYVAKEILKKFKVEPIDK